MNKRIAVFLAACLLAASATAEIPATSERGNAALFKPAVGQQTDEQPSDAKQTVTAMQEDFLKLEVRHVPALQYGNLHGRPMGGGLP